MAAFTPTRRGVLGAISLAPAALSPLALSPSGTPPRSEWDAARAAFVAADAAMHAFDRDHLTPICDEYGDRPGTPRPLELQRRLDAAQDRFDDLVGRRHDARDAMIAMPAPDRRALAFKLDVLTDDYTLDDDDVAPAFTALRDDLRRLEDS